MRVRNASFNSGWLWCLLTTVSIACSGTGSTSSANGGTQSVTTGGTSGVENTGGSPPMDIGGNSTGVTTGGATQAVGGSTQATGGVVATGGTQQTGGINSMGGAAVVGGASVTGGSQSTVATSTAGGAAVGGRGAGICPGGSYPAPDLSGTAAVVTSSSDSSQYEGTLWLDGDGVLLFSGMNTSASGTPATVNKLVPPNTVSVAVSDSGTNGLAVDFNGGVLAASQKVQGIVSINLTAGTVTTLVNTDASGKHFNCPNDLTVRTDGNIYFTDPDYQLSGRTSETGVKGVYRYSTAKVISLIDGTFNEPNGVSLSPDEATLYVADTGASKIRKFNVAADGSVSGKSDLATVTSPDGGGVDCAGNLYWASNAAPGKVVVISPTGAQLGSIALGASDKPTNVAFGGADHKTLYISTSPRKIYSITLNVPGFPY